ncbi:MAG: hypothetical protein NTV88_03210 [Candidatus Micrarchaeota archaeon]|nr:hypothetical protein [Candidatus Micrarchaeota archaeon]
MENCGKPFVPENNHQIFSRSLAMAKYLQKEYPVFIDLPHGYFGQKFEKHKGELKFGELKRKVAEYEKTPVKKLIGSADPDWNKIRAYYKENRLNAAFNQYHYVYTSVTMFELALAKANSEFPLPDSAFSKVKAALASPITKEVLRFEKRNNCMVLTENQIKKIDILAGRGNVSWEFADGIYKAATEILIMRNAAWKIVLEAHGKNPESDSFSENHQPLHIVEHAARMLRSLAYYLSDKLAGI